MMKELFIHVLLAVIFFLPAFYRKDNVWGVSIVSSFQESDIG